MPAGFPEAKEPDKDVQDKDQAQGLHADPDGETREAQFDGGEGDDPPAVLVAGEGSFAIDDATLLLLGKVRVTGQNCVVFAGTDDSRFTGTGAVVDNPSVTWKPEAVCPHLLGEGGEVTGCRYI